MMSLLRIQDSTLDSIRLETYDLAVFGCGYESRCTFIPQSLNPERIRSTVVLGFLEEAQHSQREINDRYFAENWKRAGVISMSAGDESQMYSAVASYLQPQQEVVRLLVDYSSMSRLWYAGLLNWARFMAPAQDVLVDFVYAVGQHQDSVPPMVVDEILGIPGCEGGPSSASRKVAVFGLGFDPLPALSVYDQLEPDALYAYYASPGAFPDYARRAEELNSELLKHHTSGVLALPLWSVETTFRHLAELVMTESHANVTFVPLGPKPHVLAAILLSLRFPRVACLRISTRRIQPQQVGTSGDVVVTRVHFTKRVPLVSAHREGDDRL